LKNNALLVLLAAVLWLILAPTAVAQDRPGGGIDDAYYGIYEVAPGHVIGIDRFASDAGNTWALFSDYQTGVVRRLFPVSRTELEMGPAFSVRQPVELKIEFESDAKGSVEGISLHPVDATPGSAKRIALSEEAVTIAGKNATLSGTLMLPAGKGRHPAIILLHGSGPLTRYSFGPYPHFFASLGLAVLVYDKRGTGASTGTRVDASTTGSKGRIVDEYYPEGLADDAIAAFRFLKARDDIDPKAIGFWGSSEGGMLATYVASRETDVAFAINSSGFMGPLWQTLNYQLKATLRGAGVPPAEVEEALALAELSLMVGTTGEGYRDFLEARQKAVMEKRSWVSAGRPPPSLAQLRWDWSHVYSFDPVPALGRVKCPVLALWGQLDRFTDAATSEANMRVALGESGNKDFTLKVFPDANHPLMEMPSESRMAPGVFETLSSWIGRHVTLHGTTASSSSE
jgi:pimeloyl-ACP methyl ester carboxylesterase